MHNECKLLTVNAHVRLWYYLAYLTNLTYLPYLTYLAYLTLKKLKTLIPWMTAMCNVHSGIL